MPRGAEDFYSPQSTPPMRGPTIVLLYAQGERRLIFSTVHPPHHLEGVLLSCNHMPRAAQDYFSPQSPPPMRCSTFLLSYAESSRGLFFTTVHPPPYEGFYSPVIICPVEQRTISHPSQPPPPHPYEGFYSPVIICQGEQRTINYPSPSPIRGSTILLSYAKGSRGLLITTVHPNIGGSTILLSYTTGSRVLLFTTFRPPSLLGVLLSCYHMPRVAEDN